MSPGTYLAHGWWRSNLATMAGYNSVEDARQRTEGPFREMIGFSDCEGAVGHVVAKKLALDFSRHEMQACAFAGHMGGEDGQTWLYLYAEWKAMFELASDRGAVQFW